MTDFRLESWRITSKVITRVMGGGDIRRNVINSVFFVDGKRQGTRDTPTELPSNATREQVEAELKQYLGIDE